MQNILHAQSAIYTQFHKSSALSVLGPKVDDFAAYYTAMYLIQDTGEAVHAHMSSGFSTKPLQAYLEFWGVMQAVIIQQDAVSELYRVVKGSKLMISKSSAWTKLRNVRNACAGHPANRTVGVSAPQRTFMGRSFGGYDQVTYELWQVGGAQPTHPTFNLRQMINDYDGEAGAILQGVLAAMKSKWP